MDACDAVKKCCGLTQATPVNADLESAPRRLPPGGAPPLSPGRRASPLPMQYPEESARASA